MVAFYGKEFSSRLLIGTAGYPSPAIMQNAVRAAGAEIVTVSLRRESAGGRMGGAFWSLIRELGVTILPNTAGCRSVREAVTTAQLARELFGTPWIKLEVIGDDETLQPDAVGLVEAATLLVKDGFEVFPYCTEDLTVALRLRDAGCRVIMPWAAPIGSARGILNRDCPQAFARAAARRDARGGCGARRALACGGCVGTGLRRRAAQHRRRQGGRSGRHGEGVPPRGGSRPARL